MLCQYGKGFYGIEGVFLGSIIENPQGNLS